MADEEQKEEQKIVLPDPTATKAHVFPPAEGERPVSSDLERLSQAFPPAEGERPAAGGGTAWAATQFAPAEGDRPVSAQPVSTPEPAPGPATTSSSGDGGGDDQSSGQ